MADAKVKPIPLADGATPVTSNTREMLSLMVGPVDDEAWFKVRQSLRCLTQGARIVETGKTASGTPIVEVVADPTVDKITTEAAMTVLVTEFRKEAAANPGVKIQDIARALVTK